MEIAELPMGFEKYLSEIPSFEIVNFPQNILNPTEILPFQDGYIYDSLRAEVIVNSSDELHPKCLVFATNGFDDPFFIDTVEAPNYPVYFAFHGRGNWRRVQLASSMEAFVHLLKEIHCLSNESEKLILYLKTRVPEENEFWCEVIETVTEKESCFTPIEEPEEISDDEFKLRDFIVTDLGDNSKKVLLFLKKELGITLKEALALESQKEIFCGEGTIRSKRFLIKALEKLGATVIFRDK